MAEPSCDSSPPEFPAGTTPNPSFQPPFQALSPTRRWLYRLISWTLDFGLLILSPVLILALLIASRGLTRPKLRRGLLSKLWAFPKRDSSRPAIWVHAVSVGEVLVAEPLVLALERRYPHCEIFISVSTFTGREVALKRFPDRKVVYFPLDVSFVVGRALRRLRPSCVVLVELEVWPNFLLTTRRAGVPVFVVNGRLSARSARRYRALGPLARGLFRLVDSYAVQTEEYAERFRSLGVVPERIRVLGNLKYDRVPGSTPEEAHELRARLGWEDSEGIVILVAGCTHSGEEAALAASCAVWRSIEPRLRLVIAPRHIERLVSGEIESWNLPSWRRWSELEAAEPLKGDVLVLDTVGELERFYGVADIVFVGGSLVPHGGHNVLEPTLLGKPTAFGPHSQNFREEVRYLLEESAAVEVDSAAALETWVADCLQNREGREELGRRAAQATERLRGALDRHVDWLDGRLRLFLFPKS